MPEFTIATDPTYPIAGQSVVLRLSNCSGNQQEFSLIYKPFDSALSATGVLNASGSAVAAFYPDVAGTYTFAARDYLYLRGAASYSGSPIGGTRSMKVLQSAATLSLVVGEYLLFPVGDGIGNGADLKLAIVNNLVVSATFSNFTNIRSKEASLRSAVYSARSALVGYYVSQLCDDLVSNVRELRSAVVAHITGVAGFHLSSGSSIVPLMDSIESPESALIVVNSVRTTLEKHVSKGAFAGAQWHVADDGTAIPYVAAATTVQAATVLEAHLRNRFLNHVQAAPAALLTSLALMSDSVSRTYSSGDFRQPGLRLSNFLPRRAGYRTGFMVTSSVHTDMSVVAFIGLSPYGTSQVEILTSSVAFTAGTTTTSTATGGLYFSRINYIVTYPVPTASGVISFGFGPNVHYSPDYSSTNIQSVAMPPMNNLFVVYADALRTAFPQTASNAPDGSVHAIQKIGFVKP